MTKRILSMLCVLVLATTIGCGDDETTESKSNNRVEADMDMGTRPLPDVREEPPPPPKPIPRYLTIEVTPGRAVYSTGLSVLPEILVYDINGEVIEGAGVEISVLPEGAAVPNEARFDLVQEGAIEFVACAVLPGLDDEVVCDSDRIMVDDGPPVLEITSPTPGAQLDATANAVIQVTGTVSDTHGNPRVFMKGSEVEVIDGMFSVEVTPEFGINHIELSAVDGINSGTTTRALDVIWAQDYAAVSTTRPEFQTAGALQLRMGQGFVDDGMKAMRANDGTYVTQDLADVLELLLLYIDLMSQIPNPVVDTSALSLSVTSVNVGKPRVEIDLTDQGLEIFIQIDELQVATQGGFDLEGQVVSLNGTIDAKFSALATLIVSKASPTAPVDVQVGTLTLAVEEATPNFVAPEANAIFQIAQSVLRTTLEDILRDAIEDAFVSELPAVVSDLLNGLDDSLGGQTLDLDLGLGAPVSLGLDLGIESVETQYRYALDAEMAGMCFVDGPIVGPSSRGVALDPSFATEPPFFDASRIQIALSGAFANGLLHTIWSAGTLELDARNQLPINVERADLSAKLPPVIRGPKEGVEGGVVVQLGQLELDVEILGSREVYGVFIETGIDLQLSGNSLTVTVSENPVVKTWRISQSGDQAVLTPDVLEGLVLNTVYPQLLTAVSQGLSLELPAIDLSSLGAIAAPLANLVLSFEAARDVDFRGGYIVIDANLEGRL